MTEDLADLVLFRVVPALGVLWVILQVVDEVLEARHQRRVRQWNESLRRWGP
jgi:hypothetical protein